MAAAGLFSRCQAFGTKDFQNDDLATRGTTDMERTVDGRPRCASAGRMSRPLERARVCAAGLCMVTLMLWLWLWLSGEEKKNVSSSKNLGIAEGSQSAALCGFWKDDRDPWHVAPSTIPEARG